MPKNQTKSLTEQPVNWLSATAPSGDVVLSSRARLARNLKGHIFPSRATSQTQETVFEKISDTVDNYKGGDADDEGHFTTWHMTDFSDIDRQILLERKYLSRELCNKGLEAGLSLANEKSISILINEEDHFRIQILEPGLNLQKAWDELNPYIKYFDEKLSFAFDKQLGFLTSCPSNLGTALRFSTMLQLPGLSMNDNLSSVIRGIGHLGFTVRGPFGEQSEPTGHILQLSNQATLGENEDELLQRVRRAVKQLVMAERKERETLLKTEPEKLYDYVGRAYGTLKYAHYISATEAFKCLCAVRLGCYLNMFSNLQLNKVNNLIISSQTGHLCIKEENPISAANIKKKRAQFIMEKLES